MFYLLTQNLMALLIISDKEKQQISTQSQEMEKQKS